MGSFSYHLGVPSRGSWHFEKLGFQSGLGGDKSYSEKTEVTLERQPLHSEVLSKNLPAVFIDQRTCLNTVPPIAVSKVVLWETLFLCGRPCSSIAERAHAVFRDWAFSLLTSFPSAKSLLITYPSFASVTSVLVGGIPLST